MRRCALALAVWLVAGVVQADTECQVSAVEWSRPRSAAMVLGLAGVRDCVRAWHADPHQRLVLVHAAGEESSLWAAELRDWLVALGVPSASIDLRGVGTDPELVLLRVEAPLAP